MSYRGNTINEIELVNRYEKDLSNLNAKFPPIFYEPIDYQKPDRDYIKDQISKLQPVLENDEIMISFVENLIFDEFIKPEDLCLQLKPFFNDDSIKTVKFVEAIWELLVQSSNSHDRISDFPKRADNSISRSRLKNDETFDRASRIHKDREIPIEATDDVRNDEKNFLNEKITRQNGSSGTRNRHHFDRTRRERYDDFIYRDRTSHTDKITERSREYTAYERRKGDRTPERRHRQRDRTPERRQRDQTPERRQRDRTPERRQRDRTPERRQRDRTPERRQRDRTPERRQRDRTPERRHRQRDRTPERRQRQRDRTPERRQRDRTPERRHRQRDRTPERRHRQRDRTPERRQRDQTPERRQRDRTPERRHRQRDRTPERRQRDQTPERRQRDRTPERRHRDRTPERRPDIPLEKKSRDIISERDGTKTLNKDLKEDKKSSNVVYETQYTIK